MSLRHTFYLFAALVLTVSAGPSGCATTGAGGKVTRAAADVLLPPSEEERLGEQFSQQVEQELKLHPNAEVQRYIQELGALALQSAGERAPEAINFEFNVVDAPDTVNAFAGPGGEIYFYSGLLLQAETTAEVLAVMCHEVAHVTERHIAERMVTIYGLEALSRAALGDNPGLITKLVTSVAAQGYLLKYGRSHETEADTMGVRFMLETGYDPHGFIWFFEKLAAGGGARPPEFLSTHPYPENRIDHIQKMLAKRGELADQTGRERHQQIIGLIKGQ